MGEGRAYDGLPLPGTGHAVPDVGRDYWVWNAYQTVNMLYQLLTSHGCFCFFFQNNALNYCRCYGSYVCSMVCLFRPISLYRMLAVINEYEMIDTL